jgi:polysaccharide biosynthesis protein PslG
MRVPPLTRRATLLLAALFLTLSPTSAPPVTATPYDPYGVGFGADELLPQTPRALELAAQANIDWVRLGIYWQAVEPNPGQYDFAADDALVASARANQLNVLAILAYSTPWSTSAPDNPPVNLTHYPPRDYREWADYVATVVSRYKGDIHYWEVWNEPDLAEFWSGTAAQYASLLALTYSTIKQIDPTATVVLGGQAFVDWPDHPASQFLSQILEDVDHPAAAHFDIAAFHYYLPPEQAPRQFERFKSTLAEFGIGDRPIWVTEAGLPNWGVVPGGNPESGCEAQALWLDRTLPALVDLRAERVFWFQLDENPDAPSGFGLLGPDLTPRPAYAALQSLTIQYIQNRAQRVVER